MVRVPDLTQDALDPEQRRVFDAITAGPRGGVHGPLRVWLHSAGFANRAQELGAFCRFATSLSPRLSELAILVTAAAWRASFEWHAHAPLAIQAGLDPAIVEAIRTGQVPTLTREDEAAVYAFAQELIETRQVSDTTYQRLAAILDAKALVELVGVIGYYTLIAMTINAFQVPLPPGAAEPFPTSGP
jgi:4-carboxymuconolactone decarboxylase